MSLEDSIRSRKDDFLEWARKDGAYHWPDRFASAEYIRIIFSEENIDLLGKLQLKRALRTLWSTTLVRRDAWERIVDENSEDSVRNGIKNLFYGEEDLMDRLNGFARLKYVGIGIASELLSKRFPGRYYINNRRSREGLEKLGVKVSSNIEDYEEFNEKCKEIRGILAKEVFLGAINALHVDWFLEGIRELSRA